MLSRFLPLVANIPLSIIGMMIFFLMFVLIFVWISGARSNSFYENLSQMPLQDEGHSNEPTK